MNEKFFSKLEKKILKFTSGEYSWDEHGEVASHNGRLNFEHLNISYLLSELVEQYQIETFQIFNYESFLDWFLSKWNNDAFIKTCCELVNERIKSEFDVNSRHIFDKADINQYRDILICYNHLIADLLDRPYEREENLSRYNNFVARIFQHESTDIFTLNHDLLIEFILEKNGISYSDGFSDENSCIVGSENQKLKIFTGFFNERVKIHKLHGSVDYYLFRKMNQRYNHLTDTGEYWFFKTRSYDDKHNAKRVEPETGKIVQDINFDITPQFLTGTNKIDTISGHTFYEPLYKRFEKSLQYAKTVIIIGYSYGDVHINKLLKKGLDNFNFEIINVNPGTKFPFRKNHSQNFLTEIYRIEDL